ncbi:hypothetical protein CDL15_Pgr003718 [Punica granatum]|uniref:Uncharacterized protein n=1 Tax=Punica granatum TaxID=22663 RepID=A0A218XUH3_PUNGR|nr:hypothetical protein CDL15_Pgr003718 [Punica granatum]
MSASNIDARDKMRAKDINTALARGDRPPRPAPPPSPTPFPEPFLPPPSTMTRPSPRCINEKVEDSRNARNSQSIASHHALPNGLGRSNKGTVIEEGNQLIWSSAFRHRESVTGENNLAFLYVLMSSYFLQTAEARKLPSLPTLFSL